MLITRLSIAIITTTNNNDARPTMVGKIDSICLHFCGQPFLKKSNNKDKYFEIWGWISYRFLYSYSWSAKLLREKFAF